MSFRLVSLSATSEPDQKCCSASLRQIDLVSNAMPSSAGVPPVDRNVTSLSVDQPVLFGLLGNKVGRFTKTCSCGDNVQMQERWKYSFSENAGIV